MSQENVEIARRANAAFNRGDVDAALEAFAADAELAAACGVAPDALRLVLPALGYRSVIDGDRELFAARPRRRASQAGKRGGTAARRNDNPFAKLKELRFA